MLAKTHFSKFYENVGYPISLSRGAYWLGRVYEKMKNYEKSQKWYLEGAKYLTTYYGQLAFLKINPTGKFELDKTMIVEDEYRKVFFNKELVKKRTNKTLLKKMNFTIKKLKSGEHINQW